MQILKKIYKAIQKYLFKDTRYFLLYIYRYFQDNYHNNCKFYSKEEFLKFINSGKSIIRIGDGEIGILHYLPIGGYQDYSDSIRNDFLKIVKNYTDNSKYILMIPLYVNQTNTELKKAGRFQGYMPLKLTYEMIFNKDVKYFDQHAFYRDGGFKELIIPYIKSKKVIIVTNKQNIEKIKNSKFADKSYQYIVCPSENAYESRLEIKKNIVDLINKSGADKKDFAILMGAGLLKPIIYDMCEEGYQLLDIGKGLESYFFEISVQNII
jgi:hypothetical protein